MADTLTLLKQQFATLCTQRDAILAAAAPLRAQRDSAIQASDAALAAVVAPLNLQITLAEAGLADLMNQIAQIANALNGNTAL